MAEPTSELPISLSVVSERKANIFRKAKEEAESVLESAREHTDELMKDLEETTGGITAPNLFKTAKKEMKAALRKGTTRFLHKIARGKAKDGDSSSTDEVEESETSDEEGDGTMALESEPVGHERVDPENEPQDSADKRNQSDGAELENGESAETGDKKHQDQMKSEKEEIKGINHHEKLADDHEATGTRHEKSDDHQETEAVPAPAPAKKEPVLQRKWGFMQCVGELLETACSPK